MTERPVLGASPSAGAGLTGKRGDGAAAGVGAPEEDREEQEVADEPQAEAAALMDPAAGSTLESELGSTQQLALPFAEDRKSGKVE